MPTDHTMSEISLFGSMGWAATRCGLSRDIFRRKRPAMEGDGFPKPDRLTGHYIKADVDAWIHRRRQLSDKIIEARASETQMEVNWNAI